MLQKRSPVVIMSWLLILLVWLVSEFLKNPCQNVLLFVCSSLILSSFYTQARKTEFSLQRIRQGAQRRAGASSDISDHNVSDTYKICQQLKLDIQVPFSVKTLRGTSVVG